MSKGRNGVGSFLTATSAARLSRFWECWMPALRSPTTAGKNPNAVRSAETLTRNPRDAHAFHLKITLDAHQTFATLSSNSPRSNGNIREIGSRTAEKEANGGRKGRKRRRNVEIVTSAKRKNSRPLARKH